MGKGTIVSHIGSGKYWVTLNRDRRRIVSRLTKISERLAGLPGMIIGHESARDAAEIAYNIEVNGLNGIITEMKAHPTEIKKYEKQLETQTKLILAKEAIWRAWILAVNAANLEYTSLVLEQGKLNGPDLADFTIAAWCADLTTTLTKGSIVSTAEVYCSVAGLNTMLVNICPAQSAGPMGMTVIPRLAKAVVKSETANVYAKPGKTASNPPVTKLTKGEIVFLQNRQEA